MDAEQRALSTIKHLQRVIWSYTAPFRISRIEGDREAEYKTGTCILIEIGNQIHVLTAYHVFEQYRDWQEAGCAAFVIVGDAPFATPVVSFEDRRNDIVLLAIPPESLENIDAVVYRPANWPPQQIRKNEPVLVCGLPAYLRQELSNEIWFGDFNLLQDVSSVSDRQFTLHLEHDEWMNLGRIEMPGPDVFLGGISGAPVFAVDPDSTALVGIVSEIGETLPLLFCKSLSHLPETFKCPA
jgi:hypothetical protein